MFEGDHDGLQELADRLMRELDRAAALRRWQAVFENQYCIEQNPEHHESCRRALDFMRYGH